MKALLFTTLFPSQHDPTRGIYNLRGFEALADFCEVRIVAPVPGWRRLHRPGDWMRVATEGHGRLVASYPAYWALPKIGISMHADHMHRWVRAYVAQMHESNRFDVILGAFAYPDVVVAERLAKELGLPFVAFVLGSDMNELAQRAILRPRIRSALLQAHSVVAVSHGLRQRVVELGIPADRVVVQHNGVDGHCFRLQDRAASRKALGVGSDERLVCFVGNIVLEKGADVLIEALGLLKPDETLAVNLAFIGEGSLKPQLVSRSAALGVTERVRFVGRLSSDRVALWLSAADALCLPSRREGCPNVVLEALASGRPVVASEVGGVPELIDERNGVMVPSGNAEALASAIKAVLNRSWDPVILRQTAPSLSWTDLGRTLYESLSKAVNSHGGH